MYLSMQETSFGGASSQAASKASIVSEHYSLLIFVCSVSTQLSTINFPFFTEIFYFEIHCILYYNIAV